MILEELFANKLFWIVLLSVFVTKPLKALYYYYSEGKFSPKKSVMCLGGMPSTHSCIVCAVAMGIFLEEGLGTTFFAVVSLGMIIIYDALTLRMYVEEQAKSLNSLLKKKMHVESVGHTFSEVFVGGCVGILLALIVWVI